MLDFFKSLFKPTPSSGETAKERLRLVLLSDHLSLAPEVIESLKRDLLAVISRYVEIDTDHADVTFEHREREIAMLASIPITGIVDRAPENGVRAPDADVENHVIPSLSRGCPEPVEGGHTELPPADPESIPEPEPVLEPVAIVQAEHEPEPEPEPATQTELEPLPKPKPARPAGVGRSRRRRKKYALIAASAAQTKRSAQAPLDEQASAQA